MELEARLIAQEHRLLHILRNFVNRKEWPENDPRRRAAGEAVLWRLLSPETVAIGTAGIAGVASLVLMSLQLAEMRDQSTSLRRQNEQLMNQQQHQRVADFTEQAQLNASRIATGDVSEFAVAVAFFRSFVETEEKSPEKVISRQTLEQLLVAPDPAVACRALQAYAKIESRVAAGSYPVSTAQLDCFTGESAVEIRGVKFRENLNLRGSRMCNVGFTNTVARNVDFSRSNFSHARIVDADFSNSFFSETNFKAVVLKRTNASGAKFSTEALDVEDSNLQRARLQVGSLVGHNSNLESALITGFSVKLHLSNVNLSHAKVEQLEVKGQFKNVDLRGTSFEGSKLAHIRFINCSFDQRTFRGATFEGVEFRGTFPPRHALNDLQLHDSCAREAPENAVSLANCNGPAITVGTARVAGLATPETCPRVIFPVEL